MLEILQYYTSGFWVWAGITTLIILVLASVGIPIKNIAKRKYNEK